MRLLFALALVAGALALAAGTPFQMSYTVKVANVPENSLDALHTALNGPPRWTNRPVGSGTNGGMATVVAASAYYMDKEPTSDAVWFGVNVPDDWVDGAIETWFYWGNLNSLTKWSPGPAYVISGGQYEVIPVRDNFTDSSSSIDHFLAINRPTELKMLRYRLHWDAEGPHWWSFGEERFEWWTGTKMTGEPDVHGGDSFPIVKEGDAIAVLVRVDGDKMVEYAGRQIKSAFKIGSSYIEQIVDIPAIA